MIGNHNQTVPIRTTGSKKINWSLPHHLVCNFTYHITVLTGSMSGRAWHHRNISVCMSTRQKCSCDVMLGRTYYLWILGFCLMNLAEIVSAVVKNIDKLRLFLISGQARWRLRRRFNPSFTWAVFQASQCSRPRVLLGDHWEKGSQYTSPVLPQPWLLQRQ